MTWKDTLRKAPFGMGGQERRMARQARRDRKGEIKQVLQHFKSYLTNDIDPKLQQAMQEDAQLRARGKPTNEGQYRIQGTTMLGQYYDKLVRELGMSEQELNKWLAKQYNATTARIQDEDKLYVYKKV